MWQLFWLLMNSNMQQCHWLGPGYPGATSRHRLHPFVHPGASCSSYLHVQGPKYSFRHFFCTFPGTLININFPQNFPLALIGCYCTPVLPQPWALQLLLGSTTVQTCYALCAKVYIFYFISTLILQNAYLWLPLAFQVK